MAALIFLVWGIGAYSYLGIEPTTEIKSNQAIYIGVGIFLVIAFVGFIFVKPYRPDIAQDERRGNVKQRKYRWWTGDPW